MRRWLVPLMAALVALALLNPAALAGAENDDEPASPNSGDEQLTLYAVEDAMFVTITREGEVFEDDEDFTPDVGDRFIGTETLYSDEGRTDEVGRNHIGCQVTEAFGVFPEDEFAEGEELDTFGVSFVCSGVLDLHDRGTLSWSGVTGFSSEDFMEEPSEDVPFITVAITGGTDGMIGSSGEATIFEEVGEAEDEILSRYEITLLH